MNMTTAIPAYSLRDVPNPEVVSFSASNSTAMSRLMQMQARIQERQQAQKEEKLRQIQDYESQQQRFVESLVTRSSSSGSTHSAGYSLSSSINMESSRSGGKVREMFAQRRKNKDGWDKSYPLTPISKDEKELSSSLRSQRSGKESSGHEIRRSKSHNSINKSSNKENNNLKKPTTSRSKNDLSSLSKQGSKSPAVTPLKKIPTKNKESKPKPKVPSQSNKKAPSASPGKSLKNKSKAAPITVPAANGTAKPTSAKKKEERSDPGDGRLECDICGRYFAEDRIEKHKEICEKTASKTRKVFDPTKARTSGTEAEAYIKKGAHLKEPKTPKKQDWRQKREEFVGALREAKKVQAHLNKGGKLEDLPPPPVSENPDYVKCPHCGRRFNPGAADRHIPKCQNIKSNKKR